MDWVTGDMYQGAITTDIDYASFSIQHWTRGSRSTDVYNTSLAYHRPRGSAVLC